MWSLLLPPRYNVCSVKVCEHTLSLSGPLAYLCYVTLRNTSMPVDLKVVISHSPSFHLHDWHSVGSQAASTSLELALTLCICGCIFCVSVVQNTCQFYGCIPYS